MEAYDETYKKYEIRLFFINRRPKKLPSKLTKEDAYQQGIEALRKFQNATGFILSEKTTQIKYLTEVKNK